MSSVTCPNCRAALSPQELADGWCESCGKKIPAFALTSPKGGVPPAGVVSRQPEVPRSTRPQECAICEQTRNDVATCYIRIQRTSPGVGSVTARWFNVQCLCCADCFRKGKGITRAGVIGLVVMFGLPLFLCGGGGFLMAKLFRFDGVMPEGMFGIPGDKLLNGFLGVASAISLLGFFVTPFLVGIAMRRRIVALLNPVLVSWVRSSVDNLALSCGPCYSLPKGGISWAVRLPSWRCPPTSGRR